ncbi:glycosyltransferase [Chryseobacterium sp.]|uniref:glycosyltransferase family 2 protein n=1 Tax=Chryseobacterium sp. TaxID=1871047 RepID=UPI00289B0A9D|nr:glycosyltransferase [Chryseobacterium sp.]
MAPNPLVSILIITMNHERFIEKACETAISQTYPNIEIIFLDNCSDDKTFEIGKKIIENSKIPHVFIKNTEKYNVSKNLNILVSHASGEYASILSGDDWFTEDMIAEKVDYILKTETDFVFSDGYEYINETNETRPLYSESRKSKIIKSLDTFFHENVVQNQTSNVGVFVRKNLLDKFPFDENLHTEDWDMNLKLSYNGYKPGFVDKKLFYYRILPNSLSKRWKLMQDSFYKLTSKYEDYINTHREVKVKYQIQEIGFKYEILLSESHSEQQKKSLMKKWKAEKYKIKYKKPLLFLKLFLLRFS